MQGYSRNTSNALTLNGAQLTTDSTFAGNSDTLIPSQKATKTYSDAVTTLIQQHNFLPKSQCAIAGSVDSNGQANFLSTSSGAVKLAGTTTNVLLAYANGQDIYGQKNYIESIAADVAGSSTWGTLPAGTSYLYKELDITNPTSPTATYRSSLEPPDYVTADNQSNHSLMHFEDASVILDDYGHTWTKGTGMSRSSAQAKIGTYSALSDGTTNGWMLSDFNIGGLFTLEAWYRWTTDGAQICLFETNGIGAELTKTAGNKLSLYVSSNGSSYDICSALAGGTSVVKDTWYHIALRYDGANYIVYLNGSSEITQASASVMYSRPVRLGINAGSSLTFPGYIDELRYSPYPRTVTAYTTALTKDASIYNITLRKFPYIGTNKLRLYLGEAVSNGSTVSSVITYALNGEYYYQGVCPGISFISKNHNIGTKKINIDSYLVATTTLLNYAVGDRVYWQTYQSGAYDSARPYTCTPLTVGVRFGYSYITALYKSDGSLASMNTELQSAGWLIIITANRSF